MLDLRSIFKRFEIATAGVVHVGAFIGAEDDMYRDMGFRNRLFVEAQPDTYARLTEGLGNSGAFCEQVAISNRDGTASFHITNNGQSSSLLNLDRHRQAYPEIVEIAQIEVKTTTLDSLLTREDYVHLRFNFLNMDIQGAELLALEGAERTLHLFDALQLEVNFDELYMGAPLVAKLDQFLKERGFLRTDSISFHKTWGDGFWVHDRLTKLG